MVRYPKQKQILNRVSVLITLAPCRTMQIYNVPLRITLLGGEETEDRKRAAMKMTVDDQQQDINDPRVLGTRLGGTKTAKHRARMTVTMTMKTDTKVKETMAKVQESGGAMTRDLLQKMI